MKKRIMLVDDDKLNNMINAKLLNMYGSDLEITEYLVAQDALDVLNDTAAVQPDIILLDINMPVMSGWEFLEAYRNGKGHSAVFVLTSSIAIEDIERSKAYPGVHGFITKPLNRDKISKIFE